MQGVIMKQTMYFYAEWLWSCWRWLLSCWVWLHLHCFLFICVVTLDGNLGKRWEFSRTWALSSLRFYCHSSSKIFGRITSEGSTTSHPFSSVRTIDKLELSLQYLHLSLHITFGWESIGSCSTSWSSGVNSRKKAWNLDNLTILARTFFFFYPKRHKL